MGKYQTLFYDKFVNIVKKTHETHTFQTVIERQKRKRGMRYAPIGNNCPNL